MTNPRDVMPAGLNRNLAEIQERVQLAQQQAQEVKAAKATERSEDGTVTVTVGANGGLTGLEFGERAYQRSPRERNQCSRPRRVPDDVPPRPRTMKPISTRSGPGGQRAHSRCSPCRSTSTRQSWNTLLHKGRVGPDDRHEEPGAGSTDVLHRPARDERVGRVQRQGDRAGEDQQAACWPPAVDLSILGLLLGSDNWLWPG
jgi:hypothetical protein